MTVPQGPTPRDAHVFRAVWSLGAVRTAPLAALLCTKRHSLEIRLIRLRREGWVVTRHFGSRSGRCALHALAPAAAVADPAYANPWTPAPYVFQHTLAVGETLARLVASQVLAPVRTTAWQGEGELRHWHTPGWPLPDGRVQLLGPDGMQTDWAVEVDMGTEGRAVWLRKLAGYLAHPGDGVLVVTPTEVHARWVARLAADAGVPLISCGRNEFNAAQPIVFDARLRRSRLLSEAVRDADDSG